MIYNYGSVTFTAPDGLSCNLQLGPVQKTIAAMIVLGCVIQTEKTKHGTGRKAVTIGPYRCATDDKTQRWAVYIGNDKTEYLSPVDAARDFIAWCGTRIARDAVREYARKN